MGNNWGYFKMYDDGLKYSKAAKACPRCGEPMDPTDCMCDNCWDKQEDKEKE